MRRPRSVSAAVADALVIDTGVLIALSRAGALDLLPRLPYRFICSPEVRAELDTGAVQGHPAVHLRWIHIVPLRNPLQLLVEGIDLDPGEASVIQLAREQGNVGVCADDAKARRAAQAAGLKVTGSLGLLIRAKTLGLVPAIRPLVEQALAAGIWYDTHLVNRVLASVGEL